MAGCDAVMMSLWPVNDAATCALMTKFYSVWLEKRAQQTQDGAKYHLESFMVADAWQETLQWWLEPRWKEQMDEELEEQLRKTAVKMHGEAATEEISKFMALSNSEAMEKCKQWKKGTTSVNYLLER